ncbi:MAG: DCC1-like thiol-disulfide oxidoreductase family protein [Pseudomonadales bacterium]|nr:DCC1-like thiol-disulfide oxidoreductase family protein [Pseudomonadales bacterium]
MPELKTLPPHLTAADRVILFDGVCRLCAGWSQFILRYDRDARFKLCSVQSPEGQAILRRFAYPTDKFDTMLYVEAESCYERSDALLRILQQLPRPWSGLSVLRWIPGRVRDWGYNLIARNRYRLFGRLNACRVPPPEYRQRFVEHI